LTPRWARSPQKKTEKTTKSVNSLGPAREVDEGRRNFSAMRTVERSPDGVAKPDKGWRIGEVLARNVPLGPTIERTREKRSMSFAGTATARKIGGTR
jgi:hypothetical protein